MAATAERLRPSEAAVVASVALRDVNRVIDERILPEAFFTVDDGRHVLAAACPLISFYFDSAERLTSKERLFAIREAGSRFEKFHSLFLLSLAEKSWTIQHEFLTIDLAPFVKRAKKRLDQLIAARNLVATDPEVLGGTPIVRGTRIPIHDVAASLVAGIPRDRILAAYPALDTEKLDLVAIYALANPARGRPRSHDELPAGTVIVADRRTARRGTAG